MSIYDDYRVSNRHIVLHSTPAHTHTPTHAHTHARTHTKGGDREHHSLTGHGPEDRVVSAVGDGGGVSVAVLPQVGPVPGHLDDEGARLPSDLTDPPEIHGQAAQHEEPAQRGDQEAEHLDQTLPHACVVLLLSFFFFSSN